MGVGEKKTTKKVKKRRKNEQKAEKLNKMRKNDTFLCKKAHKFAHSFPILTSALKIGRFIASALWTNEWLAGWMLKWGK